MTRPLFADGVLYLGGGYSFATGTYVQAFDLGTDSEIWRFDVGTGFGGGRLLVDADVLYGGTHDGLFALDRRSGTPLWTFGGAGHQRAVSDGVMYTSSGNSLVALEGATGAELWRLDTSEQLSEPPVPLGDRLYVGDAGSLLVVDRVSGALIEPSRRFAGVARLEAIGSRLWSVARVAGRPDRVTMAWDPEDDALVVHDGQIVGFGEGVVYLADRDSLRLIDAASDAERATYDGLPTARLGGVAVHGGTMFQQNLTGRPHALDAFDLASGRLLWTFEASDMIHAPVLARERLWVASDDCHLYAFDLE
jgi:outer membrane protein assembly factor BamB